MPANSKRKPVENESAASPPYLAAYSASQLKVIYSDAPINQVVAAAGSGKTRTVIGFIEHILRSDGRDENGFEGDPVFTAGRRILMLSFSRRAVGELRARLPVDLARRVEVSTFHSFCFRRLSRMRSRAGRAPVRIITDEERQEFLRACLASGDFDTGGIPYGMLFNQPERFARHFPGTASRVFRRYRAYKRKTGLMEYDDLVEEMLQGLRLSDAPDFDALRTRYPLIVVDEFQDTDPRQLEFLRLMRPQRLTVVGDDWQAIYAFRGATVEPFLNFRRSFPGARVFRLSQNYRSLRPIVRLGNALIRASRRQLRKAVSAVRGRGPGFPVLAFALASGRETQLAELCRTLRDDDGRRILVRTNYRRRRWLAAGFAPEQVLTIHKAKGLEFPVVFVDLMGGWNAATAQSPSVSSADGGGSQGGPAGFVSATVATARKLTGRPGAIVRSAVDRLHDHWRGDEPGERPEDEEIRILYVAASRAENLLVFLRDPGVREESREHWFWSRLCRPAGARETTGRELSDWLRREQEYRGG